jgi:hypothetical protein
VIDPVIWIYTTVTLMSILVVYDGWGELKGPGGIVIVVVGPTIALAAAHVFADVIGHTIHHGSGPGRHMIRDLGLDFLQYLLVAVPALLVLFIVSVLLHQSPSESIRSMLLFGALSLGVWGGVAGWRGGARGWRLALAITAGLVVGLIVFGFQLVLKPH